MLKRIELSRLQIYRAWGCEVYTSIVIIDMAPARMNFCRMNRRLVFV